MGDIRILDDHIANQIAAGEVVERPSSVVKELVENAVDAGSSRIDVSIDEGGIQYIRVTDNGKGILPDDLEIAFSRHATSKISSGKDLFQIRTLGFRGEALPSIAAVSRVTCTSAANENGLGKKLEIEGGKIQSSEEIAAPRGTDIQVKELFFNTPARLKYLKTVQTELNRVSDYIYRLAMAHPNIAFSFQHNQHLLLQTLGNGDLKQTIAAIYGTSIAKMMLPLDCESLDYELTGYISMPETTRANRNAISTFVNGRYIRNYAVNNAILQAYHTLLPINRYPIGVLHLQMDPSLIDVNVHPAKLEVRFSKEKELMEWVEAEIKAMLRQQVLIPMGNKEQKTKKESSPIIQEQMELYRPAANIKVPSEVINKERDVQAVSYNERDAKPKFTSFTPKTMMPEKLEAWLPKEETLKKTEAPQFPHLYPIGQMHGTYIVAQNEEGLFLIDQHAAHERINYEDFYKKFGTPAQASQEMLVPITLEFTPSDAELLQNKLHLFEQVGVHLEFFGGNAYLVRSHPHWFPKGEERRIIEEMAEWLLAEKTHVDLAKMREKSAILVSCKASIKANQKLSVQEIEILLDKLKDCNNPYTCPHGRPIVISFSNYELEKMFKRVM